MTRTVCLLFATVVFFAGEPLFSVTPPLEAVLDKAARQASGYLAIVSDVRCTETVRQVKLDKNGRSEYSEESVYDYFVLLQGDHDELMLNESRIAKREPRERKGTPMLVSNGFSMLYLIFHPYYRRSFQFEAEPDEVSNGHNYRRVRFSHIPGYRTPAAVSVRGREYPLELEGEAWFDAETGIMARIEAHVSHNMADIGLKHLHVNVQFTGISLPGWSEVYSFPTSTTVELESLRQHWRNEHQFTDYKRFLVETQQTVADKDLPKQ